MQMTKGIPDETPSNPSIADLRRAGGAFVEPYGAVGRWSLHAELDQERGRSDDAIGCLEQLDALADQPDASRNPPSARSG